MFDVSLKKLFLQTTKNANLLCVVSQGPTETKTAELHGDVTRVWHPELIRPEKLSN